MALLKNSESELMSLLPSSNEIKSKPRSTTVTSNNENHNDEEIVKVQRTNSTNYGSRVQHTGILYTHICIFMMDPFISRIYNIRYTIQ